MAYVSQDEKKAIAPKVKALLKKFGLKGSLSIDNHSTLVLTVKSGKIDFITDFNRTGPKGFNGKMFTPSKTHVDVNPYWCQEHFTGDAKEFAVAAVAALKGEGWYDKSDIQSDYFCTKHYVAVKIGRWDQPYVLEA